MLARTFAAIAALISCGSAAAAEANFDRSFAVDGNLHYNLGGDGVVDQAYDARLYGRNYLVLQARGPAAGERFFHLVTLSDKGVVRSDVATDVPTTPFLGATLTSDGGAIIPMRRPLDGLSAVVVYRILPDGTRDPSFGFSGRGELAIAGFHLYPTSVHVDAQGRITIGGTAEVVGGGQPTRSFVGRLAANGLQQAGFGTNGVAFWQQDPSGIEAVRAVLGHSSGLVYGCGDAEIVGSRYATLVQFNAAGVQNFAYAGTGTVFYTADTPQQNRVTLCSDVAEHPVSQRTWMAVEWQYGAPLSGAARAFALSVGGNAPTNAPDLLTGNGHPAGVDMNFDPVGRLLLTDANHVGAGRNVQIARTDAAGMPQGSFNGVGQVAVEFEEPPFTGTDYPIPEAVAVFEDHGHIVSVANYDDVVSNEGFVVYRLEGDVLFRDGLE